jgi:hypothetical protein
LLTLEPAIAEMEVKITVKLDNLGIVIQGPQIGVVSI